MPSHFRRGSGMFACEHCGRNTRDTHNDNGDVRLCPDCYEGLGFENEACDTPSTDPRKVEAALEARACFERAIRKGGHIPSLSPRGVS